MAVLTPDSREEQDSAYNPGEVRAAEQFGGVSTAAGIDQAEAFANDPANASKELKDQEETPGEIPYTRTGNGRNEGRSWKAILKKRGPVGGIIALLLGGGAGLSFLFTPGLVAIHMVETLTDDLNDQVAAFDSRTDHVFRAKLKGMTNTVGICSSTVNIRCKFSSMNKYQIGQFEKAGFQMKCGDSPCDRTVFNKLTSIVTPNGDEITNPRELMGRSITDPALKHDIRRAYNPVFRMMSDATANSAFGKWGGKGNRFTDTKRSELHKKLLTSTETEVRRLGKLTKVEPKKEGEEPYWTGEGGQKAEGVTTQAQADTHNTTVDRLNASGGVGKVASRLGKGVGALGAADIGCSIYTMYRSVSTSAKLLRSEAFARYATATNSLIQAAKESDETVTPEQMEMIGTLITETDPRKEIIDPSSDEKNVKMMANPNYGKSAMDSAGYSLAAYGDVPKLQPESTQYMVGGGLVGVFEEYGSFFRKKPDGCDFIQHPLTRIGSGIIGLALGVGSLGTTLAISVAASATGAFVLSYLEGMLTDILAGNPINENTRYTQVGDALFSGTGAVLGGISKVGFLRPLTDDTVTPYMELSSVIKDEYAEGDRIASSGTPLDVNNQYSFLGSLSRKLLPYTTQLTNTATLSTALPRLVTGSISSLTPLTSAAPQPNRFKQCDDVDYKSLKIAADVFCNVRYGLSQEELAMDSEENLNWMIDNGHIDEETGEAKSDEYKEYIEDCASTTEAIYNDEDGKIDKYIKCTVDGKSDVASFYSNKVALADSKVAVDTAPLAVGKGDKTYNHFRVYGADKRIVESMESEPVQTSSVLGSSGAGGQFNLGSYNICYGKSVSGGYADCARGVDYGPRLATTVDVIKNNNMQVVGLQEVRIDQWRDLQKPEMLGSTYDIYPKPYDVGYGAQNPIIWDKSRFELVNGKLTGGHTVTSGYNDKANTQVKLRIISGDGIGQMFYLINVHEPVGNRADQRKNSATQLAGRVKELSGEGVPIFITGDFNSKYQACGPGVRQEALDCKRDNLPYCILTKDTGLWDAWDAFNKKPGTCPSSDHDGGPGPVDHIYTSTGVEITKYKYFGGSIKSNGSDHKTLLVGVSIPGADDSSANVSKDGWVWPVPEVTQLGTLAYGGVGSKGKHKGIDIGVRGGTLGKDVVAAHDGVVDKSYGATSDCGYYLIIKATGTDYYMGYQHLATDSIKVKPGDNVKAGDVIGKVGTQGGDTCGTTGFYHLHFSIESKSTISEYADPWPNGTIDPLRVLPR